MQEGYFNEKNRDTWLQTADILKTVNDQVIEDIEDYILLEAFGDMDTAKINEIIDADQVKRIKEQKMMFNRKQGDVYYQ